MSHTDKDEPQWVRNNRDAATYGVEHDHVRRDCSTRPVASAATPSLLCDPKTPHHRGEAHSCANRHDISLRYRGPERANARTVLGDVVKRARTIDLASSDSLDDLDVDGPVLVDHRSGPFTGGFWH
jgi:hypothetical protein